MESLQKEFLLDPKVTYLNHGSFGAIPRVVFERYQNLQRELERQPVAFLGRGLRTRMDKARQILADYLHAPPEHIVFVNNTTTAINIIARNLTLRDGDEVLATDHEYGTMDRTWKFLAGRRGFKYIQQTIRLPIQDPTQIIDQLWKGINQNTRVLFLSHITSPTAIIIPIEEICAKARAQGIITVIDGAHAPGQIPLDIQELGTDFYAGNLHKWLCAPKGAGFLYAHPDHHSLLLPLIVSWGWESEEPGASLLIDHHEWQGTQDPAAWLAVPEAIKFQRDQNWEAVRLSCHELAMEVQERVTDLTGIPPLANSELFVQMVSSELPNTDPDLLQRNLLDKHGIEIPVFEWRGRCIIRTSIQGYNCQDDVDHLIESLRLSL